MKNDEGDSHSMRAELRIGKDGGTLDIQNTGVNLKIPPGALQRDYCIQMRIIPLHETELSFASNSSVVVELLPNNVKLLKPATLTLPHHLVLKKICGWKAKGYSSHHNEGTRPQWEEERNAHCDVTYETCGMRIYNFSWKKVLIHERIVEAKRIMLYVAKRSIENKICIDIGYYWDLPHCQEVFKLNDAIVLHETPAMFVKHGKLPLTILFQRVVPPNWTIINEEKKEISFSTVAVTEGSFCTFILNKMPDDTNRCECYFKAGQGTHLVDLRFSLRAPIVTFSNLKEELSLRLTQTDCEKLGCYFSLPPNQLRTIITSPLYSENFLLALEEKGCITPSNVNRLTDALTELKIQDTHVLTETYMKLRDPETEYDRFLASLAAHLTMSITAKMCDNFKVTDDNKETVISSQNPGHSFLLKIDEMGIIHPSDVSKLETPLQEYRLLQAVAKIHEYQSLVLSDKTKPQDEDKENLFIKCLQQKIKSCFETMTPVPWKKSCQWKANDLFIASRLVLTTSKTGSKISSREVNQKCKLHYLDIFTEERLKAETRIILEGQPGSGKTMLSYQLAYDWCCGKLMDIPMVIYLPLKIVDNMTIIQAIKIFYIRKGIPITEEDIESIINSSKKKVYLILDALEEYNGGTKDGSLSEVMKVMTKEKLSNLIVIITARTDHTKHLPPGPLLKIESFGEDDRSNYIKKVYSGDQKRQEKLKELIDDIPFILDLCNVPLLFVMLVHNIDRLGKLKVRQLDRATPFVKAIVDILCPVQDKEDTSGHLSHQESYISLEELAFNGLCKGNQQLFWQKDFVDRRVTYSKAWIDSGILVVEEGTPFNNPSRDLKTDSGSGSPQTDSISDESLNASSVTQEIKTGVSLDPDSLTSVNQSESKPIMESKEKKSKLLLKGTTAKYISLQVKFLHKLIQEWFAAKYLARLFWGHNLTEHHYKYQLFIEHLANIDPADLHYVLRFTCHICPPGFHVIASFLMRDFKRGDCEIPDYIINCICLSFAEYDGYKGHKVKDIVTKICRRESVNFSSGDSQLLLRSKVSMLTFASRSQIPIKCLKLSDVVEKLTEKALILKADVSLGVLNTLRAIEVSRWDQMLIEQDYEDLIKFIINNEKLEVACLIFPSPPVPVRDEKVLNNLRSRKILVEWIIGAHLIHTLNVTTGEWMMEFRLPGRMSAKSSSLKPISETNKTVEQQEDKNNDVPSEGKDVSTSSLLDRSVPSKSSNAPQSKKRGIVESTAEVIDVSVMNLPLPYHQAIRRKAEENPTGAEATTTDSKEVTDETLQESSLSRNEAAIPLIGNATAGDTHEEQPSAIVQTEDSAVSEESLQMILRIPRRPSSKHIVVTNVKEMKEDAKEFGENKRRLLGKRKFEEGSVTSADEVSICTNENIKKDEGDSHSMRAESMIGKDGGTLDIQNTGFSLKIPPGALRRDYCVQMRIIPHHYLDETELSFASNSSVVVELLPNNVTLLKPATLTLPHCLVLKKKCGWKAKVYSSHHKKGNKPQWEEERNAHCDVTDETCVMWLDNFNWMKVQIGDDIVEAKKIILYAAMRSSFEDEIFIEIGYYWQLPSCRKVLNLNHAIVLHKIPVIFYKDGQLPLTILFEKVVPPNWTCNEGNNAKVIKFITVAFIEGDFCTFLLKKGVSDETDGCKCYFKAGQGSDLVDFKFSLKESSLSTTEVIIPSTGKATAGDIHEGLLSATEHIGDSDFSEKSLQMPSRRLRRSLPEPFVTNTKEMKEDTKEVETNETRLSDKTGNIEKGSVTSVDQVAIRTDKNIIETDESDSHSMRAESMIGKDGGTLDIQNTDVSLEIPPGALRRDYFVQMRIIPQHYRDETELPFTSYSSVVVELLPNNVKLLKPATLTLPHCLVLKKKCRWKAKVYSSHHTEGNQPQWEEERNTKCDVTYENCVMRLHNFCWIKVKFDGHKVKAMRIMLFAAKRFHNENEIFLDIGYYWDLPSCQGVLKLNHAIVLHKKPFVFYKKGQLPLKVLQKELPPIWIYNEENSAKEIKFSTVENVEGDFCTFLLKKGVSDETDGCACFFKAGQQWDLVDLIFPLKESSLSSTEAIIPSTGNATSRDIHEERPSAIAQTEGSAVSEESLLYLSERIEGYGKFVGRNLGVTEGQLCNIEQMVDTSLKEKTYQMLRVWKMKMASAATYDVLGDALKKAGRADLQEDLLKTYQPT